MLNRYTGTEIAIIGMAGRFPGANNVDQFWHNLRDGVESISFLGDEELLSLGVDSSSLRDTAFVRARAHMDGIDLFDAAFFGISPKEAEIMDPQHRVFLECAWEALENAGYDPVTHSGAIGVFGGATINTYLLLNLFSNTEYIHSLDPVQINIGNGGDFLTTRVSYKLNLKGPSHQVQCACSTSLVAVHIACQSLLNEESDMALAGGVSINVSHRAGYRYIEGGMLSPDGHCRAFDARGQGTIFGSGVGIVVLKRLKEAIADRDYIHAVIKGSAINNDGSLKIGYTAPSVEGQAEVIAEALANAGVSAETIGYVEAHGTATPLGDPVELQALTKAFRADTDKKSFCAIGSVKTNIGHLDAAAGISGLIKTVLALKNKTIPPSLHFETPNPQIDFEKSPFRVNSMLSEWKSESVPRRAGVSSFGVGGTNAHIIVEEAPLNEQASPAGNQQLMIVSAKSGPALDAICFNLADHLSRNPSLNLDDVAYTLHAGRRHFKHRRMAVCNSLDDAALLLKSFASPRVLTTITNDNEPKVVFMFPGQGSQYARMSYEVYSFNAVFRNAVDYCCECLKPHLGFDLRALLYPEEDNQDAIWQINETRIAQPALFVIEYALATMWMSWGIKPNALIGHSIGEFVAACIAGVFSLEDALALVADRGRMMQGMSQGSMMAVPMAEHELGPLLGSQLSIAAINSPTQSVVAGPTDAILELKVRLSEDGIICRSLSTSHAFHCEMMEPVVGPFTERVRQVTLRPPQIPYISNVTGDWITAAEACDTAYWGSHLRRTVRFSDGLYVLLQEPGLILLETGPGLALTRLASHQPGLQVKPTLITSLPGAADGGSELASLLTALGKLWLMGAEIDWSAFYSGELRHRVPLPSYPFEHKAYWVEPRVQSGEISKPQVDLHKKADVADWFYVPSWKLIIPTAAVGCEERPSPDQRCLMFDDGSGFSAAMLRRLKQTGFDVVTVSRGACFERQDDNRFTINAGREDDYKKLVEALRAADKLPDAIIHLWSLTHAEPAGGESFDEIQEAGYYSLLLMARALAELDGKNIEIQVVSNNVCAVTDNETLIPEKATMLAPCKVIAQEHPNIRCSYVDVVIPATGTSQEATLIDRLIADPRARLSDDFIAYRGNQCWTRTFEPVRLGDNSQSILREEGVYLIVGSSGIAQILSKHLSESVRARQVVVEHHRDNIESGPQYTRDNQNSKDQITRANASDLTESNILRLIADLTDKNQMESVLARAVERFGHINGIIYAPSVSDGRTFRTVEETLYEESEWHFVPKARGLYVLDEILRDKEIDFCLLCASLSSVLGGAGTVAHTSASLFMDSFAQSHNRTQRAQWLSADWDVFHQDGLSDGSYPDLAQYAMKDEEVAEAFRRILSAGAFGQVAVSTCELSYRFKNRVKPNLTQGRGEASTASEAAMLHPRPQLQNAYVPPSRELERVIVEIWQKALGIEEVGIADNFFDLGGDSLIAIQVASQLKKELKIEIPVVSLYEGLTVSSLVNLLEELQGEKEQRQNLAQSEGRETRSLQRKEFQQKQRIKKRRQQSGLQL